MTLADVRARHDGDTVIVCGCGTSLRALSHPERFITIGVNDVGRLFDPTYLVVVNPRSQFKTDRFRYVERSNAQALFTQLDLGAVKPPVIRFRLGKFGGTDVGAGDTLHYTQNSPYVAVCLAAYMGARRIGLIGVDLTDDHFFAHTGRHSLSGRLREIDAQYGRLAQALQARGVQLVNLSSISRLTSLSRAHVTADSQWVSQVPVPPVVQEPEPHPAEAAMSRRRTIPHADGAAMRIAIERRSGSGVVAELLDALATSASRLGHAVVRDPRALAQDPHALSIVWNGRRHVSRGPTLYCEHGWLPRSAYQISPAGINAGSHLAPFTWSGTPLTPEEDAALDAQFTAIKTATFDGYYQYMQADKEASSGLPADFLLVPLQIESDTNIIDHAPASLRTMQALIDHIAKVNPPWPVIFKQHPADARRGNRHLRLRPRRPGDLIWPQSRGNIHQMLRSGSCRGIITINSNVAHDGLLWNVPAIVLGRNIWPHGGEHLPFLVSIPRDWSALAESVTSPMSVACRRAYAHFLIAHQWTLADVREPRRVATLLATARADRPIERAGRSAVVPSKPRLPAINVVAENRGWLFEAWKRAFATTSYPGFEIVTSNKPMPQAAAWIFIRAKEAVATPNPSRTLVQLHDLLDDGAYRSGGVRACVANCGGVSLTHPEQQDLLAASGIDLQQKRWLLQPVGWGTAATLESAREARPTIAWIGRPATHGGVDVSRLAWFVEAAVGMRNRPRVVLIGERLGRAAETLRRAGLPCQVGGIDKYPPLRAAEWVGRFDCVAICGGADSGPWPLFDALHAGVPVVAASVGWAGRLLADGACGRLAEGPSAMAAAIDTILSDREQWGRKRGELRERVAALSLSAWVQTNLALAADLARPDARPDVHA